MYGGNTICSDVEELFTYRLDKTEYHQLYGSNTIFLMRTDDFQHRALRPICSVFLEPQIQIKSFSLSLAYLWYNFVKKDVNGTATTSTMICFILPSSSIALWYILLTVTTVSCQRTFFLDVYEHSTSHTIISWCLQTFHVTYLYLLTVKKIHVTTLSLLTVTNVSPQNPFFLYGYERLT